MAVPAGERLLTVREVAVALRVSTMTVYGLIRGGELRALRVGHSYRIRESDVDAYREEVRCCRPSSGPPPGRMVRGGPGSRAAGMAPRPPASARSRSPM